MTKAEPGSGHAPWIQALPYTRLLAHVIKLRSTKLVRTGPNWSELVDPGLVLTGPDWSIPDWS